jgi:hypothetical protein
MALSVKREMEIRQWIAEHVRFIPAIEQSPQLKEEAILKLLRLYANPGRLRTRVR